MAKQHSKKIGGATELAVAAALRLADKTVLAPMGEDNLRFDLVIYTDPDLFKKVQCKTGKLIRGAIRFSCCSNSYNYRTVAGIQYGKRSYIGQIDYFGVYCKETGKCYLVPISDLPKRQASLRVELPKSYNGHKIRWAEDYLIEPSKPNNLTTQTSIPIAYPCFNCGNDTGTKRSLYCSDECVNAKNQKKKISIPKTPKPTKPKPPCAKCGNLVKRPNAVYCSVQCFQEANQKVQRPSKEQLEQNMRSQSWVDIAEQYGVSDNAVKKWAKRYGIAFETRPYRTKIENQIPPRS